MNSKRLLPLCGLICATAMLGACVGQGSSNAANESMYLEQRVQEHDTLLRQMQPAQAEVWNQVQAMRQELNTLKGLVDDLKNVGGAAALAERVRAHDAALRQVETSMALNLNLGEPMAAGGAAPAHAAAPQANAPLFQPQQNPYAAPAAGAAAKQLLLAGGQVTAAAAKAERDLAHRQDDGAIGGDDLPPDDGIGINESLQVFHIAFGQLTQIMCHSSNLRKVY